MEELQLFAKVLARCLVFSAVWRCLDTPKCTLWVQEPARIDGSAELLGSQ